MSSAGDRPVPNRLLYNKLPRLLGQHQIRLLCLHPDASHEPISCSFSEHSLEDAPPYKALSYAWVNENYVWNEQLLEEDSAESAQRSITYNNCSILIGTNLYSALQRLRGPHQPRFIWVDAICINQNDPEERTQQVLHMKDVYRGSAEVVIWLGERRAGDDMGAEFLASSGRPMIHFFGDHRRDKEKLDAFLARERRRTTQSHGRDIFGAFCVLSLLAHGDKASRLEQIRKQPIRLTLSRGWRPLHRSHGYERPLHPVLPPQKTSLTREKWRRSWVIQETVVAKEATVCYDNISAPWDMFARAASTYERENLNTNVESVYSYFGQLTRLSRLVREVETARTMWWDEQQRVTLPSLLRIFRPKGATDPRDKCHYARLHPWGRGCLLADHHCAPEAHPVTFRAERHALQTAPFFLHAVLGSDWSSESDLYEAVRLANAHHYDAAGGIPAGDVRLHLGRVLEVQGLEVDRVIAVGNAPLPLDVEGLGSRWRFVIDDWERVAGGPSGAFWKTLCGDLEYERDRGLGGEFCRVAESQWETYASWRDADRFLRKSYRFSVHGFRGVEANALLARAEQLRESQDAQAKHVFQYSVECASGGRAFFVNREGRLGTGPPDTRAACRGSHLESARARVIPT
ncbi:hypothetical protein SCUP234_06982 [Seiridium cupressi]